MAISHTYLTANNSITDDNYTRARAIRAKCLDCCCWQSAEVRQCTAKNCPLYPFRMGRVAAAQKLEKSEHSPIFGQETDMTGRAINDDLP